MCYRGCVTGGIVCMSVWCVSEGKGQRVKQHEQAERHPQQESSYSSREGEKKDARMRDVPLPGKVLRRRRPGKENDK